MPREILMPVTAIPAAGTSTTTPLVGLGDVGDILLQAAFDYGSGGTSVDAYVQTSIDGGTTWIDIANFRFTTSDLTKVVSVGAGGDLSALATPTDGSLAANTTVDGILGDQYRVKLVVVGTYAASTLSIFMQTRTDLGAPSTLGLSAAALAALESITAVPTSAALTNRSGTIATGATAQDAAAALATRKYLFLLNPATETEILWFSTVATAVAASPSIPLYPGQSFEMNGMFCSSGALSVIAATTGHVFIAREG